MLYALLASELEACTTLESLCGFFFGYTMKERAAEYVNLRHIHADVDVESVY